ncbi:MAG: chemotaxis protein CheB [Pseudomonadota bacterium]
MTSVKVLLVARLPAVRSFVHTAVSQEPGICVVATATNLMQAYAEAEDLKPAIALVSEEFTALAEFEMLAALFAALDTRWLVITGAGSNGQPPPGPMTQNYGIFSVDARDNPRVLMRTLQTLANSPRSTGRRAPPPVSEESFRDAVVLIGSSTGGVDALSEVLSRYPENCPPTFIVQHTGASFGESLVSLLNNRCAASVVAARDRQTVTQGMVCVGAGQKAHLKVGTRGRIFSLIVPGQAVSGHMPSVDVLFRSALPVAHRVVACVLTGMGRDGAEGLLDLRRTGARTFVQDEGSSVVYGMPRVAWEIGAGERRVPITRMCDTILDACRSRVPGKEAI